MNYKNHYDNLIKKAQSRHVEKDLDVERHHIMPKCLGGVNRKSNIVKLFPHEHFVAHQLLVKIYPDHAGLKYALYKMTLNTKKMKRNNKQYSWIKKELSIANKINATERWKDNQTEKDAYSKRTKQQWEDMSEDDYTSACKLRSDNQTGSGNSFYKKKHKKESKDKISNFRKQYYSDMSDLDRLNKIVQIRKVSIDNIVYPGLSFAAKKIEISAPLLHYRINSKSKKWENYIYI